MVSDGQITDEETLPTPELPVSGSRVESLRFPLSRQEPAPL